MKNDMLYSDSGETPERSVNRVDSRFITPSTAPLSSIPLLVSSCSNQGLGAVDPGLRSARAREFRKRFYAGVTVY